MNIFNRFLISIFLLLGAVSTFSNATATETNIITEDKTNASMVNTLDATDIVDLSAYITNSTYVISNFIIKSLPSPNLGTLYMADETRIVTVGQQLTRVEADGLKFDPIESCTPANAQFTYAGVSDAGVEGTPPATVTLPLSVSSGCSATVTSDDKKNPEMLNTLGAVNILDLSGKDGNGDAVNRFIITSLPSVNQGVLYMADGRTAVRLNHQELTLAEANGLRFDPRAGFVGDVTFTYVALDDNGLQSTNNDNATVTIPLINPVGNAPTADDKMNPKMLNTLGAVNILDLSGKDSNGNAVGNFIITSLPSVNQGVLYMADGRTAVTLNHQELTLAESNGLRFDPNIDFVGDVQFTYVAVDSNDVNSSNATVTIPVVASYNTDIVTHDDVGIANGNSEPIIIDVLANDTGTLAGAIVRLVNSDGTFSDEITVNGEGVWSVNSDNMLIFTPVTPFVGTPTAMDYLVRDANGAVSNTSTVSINGKCVCKAYTEDVPIFSTFGLVLMMFLSMMLGLHFIKREIIES